MYCTRCGYEDVEGSDYCTMCGAPLDSAQSEGASPRETVSMSEYLPGRADNAWSASAGYADNQVISNTSIAPPPKQVDGRKYAAAVVAVIVAAITVILAIGVATNWFGQAKDSGSQSATAQDASSASGTSGASSCSSESSASASTSGAVPVRDSVDDYSWQELSQIAELIAADDGKDASKLVRRYHLVNEDGDLDGSQSKELVLENGVKTRVQIIGFAHDVKSGKGKAGITFMFEDCIAEHVYNGNGSNAGGWKGSEVRAWLNDDLIYLLPSELRDVIVEVRKDTNNVGKTTSTSSVTATSDKLWLLSFAEAVGKITMQSYENAYERIPSENRATFESFFAIWNAEGFQYQLFRDRGVVMGHPKTLLVKDYLAESGSAGLRKDAPCEWWGRSPSPGESNRVQSFDNDGSPRKSTSSPNEHLAVAPCFCV